MDRREGQTRMRILGSTLAQGLLSFGMNQSCSLKINLCSISSSWYLLLYHFYLVLTLNAFEIVIKSWWILQNYRAHVQIIDHSLVRPFKHGKYFLKSNRC